MKKILLAVVACLLLATCNLEKDEKGYFLASNYCTATINGKEYIDRESYALPRPRELCPAHAGAFSPV